MNIAYCSPFNPIKSGISDFSEELVMELKKHVDIDLFYNKKPNNDIIIENFRYYDIKELYKDDIRLKYDVIIYQMGNNYGYHKCIAETFMKFPGILELHDLSLHNYIAGETFERNNIDSYIEYVKYSHGENGVKIVQDFLSGKTRAPWETHALELTVNKHLLDKAKGVIVHSDMAKQMVKGIRPDVPVINIQLHTNIDSDFESIKLKAKKTLNIDEKTLVMGSFGYATRAKRIIETLEALARYKNEVSGNFHYFIVGKVEEIDIDGKIEQMSLEKNVTVTGYTDLSEFQMYMSACDICINLRYPTHGESSASLHRMLGMGKPVIVTNVGSFEEYPDEIAVKVRYDDNEINDIYYAICKITGNKNKMRLMGNSAIEYVKKNCCIENNVLLYSKFFNEIESGNFQDDILDCLIDKLFELGLTDDNYVKHLFHEKRIDTILQ